ncbi:hypothetical protein WICMUC_002394 [Wickerhamomyces mucosus]|uniref:GPI transamidase component GPI17 n=1 Tax=Wickerhamomyces mucosus TaxID=1378264 RepID=A0A9P8PPX2_9ASCO|nr:hypothetical protein WICMUC_002394 [Wickerhamomyces mucosus]
MDISRIENDQDEKLKLENSKRISQLIQSESADSLLLRRWVVISIILIYVFIGLPVWFKLTEIYRAPLPSNFINMLQNNQNIDLKIHNTVYLRVGDQLKFPDLPEATQIQINHELHQLTLDPQESLIVDWNVSLTYDQPPNNNAYILELEVADSEGIAVDEISKVTTLFYTLQSIKNNDLPFFVTQTILQHIFKTEIEMFKTKNQKIKNSNVINYSPKVHLSFKLLTGDGLPIDWEIDQAINEYFKPLTQLFKNYIEFSIDSEIKYFTQLNLKQTQNETKELKLNELSTILDFSDWDVSLDQFPYPQLNFILYFPSEKQSPLNFEFSSDEQVPFLIPQWGSIILHKYPLEENSYIKKEYLLPVLETFTSELFTLLGLPKDPKNPFIRLDALLKYTIIDNLNKGIDSLSSLLKLSESLPNISIPKTVLNNVKRALLARNNIVKYLNEDNDFENALLESIKVLKYSEDAFFDREMVQQNFFPQEHKVAVYLPLLGPLTLICLLGLKRVLSEIKVVNAKRQ